MSQERPRPRYGEYADVPPPVVPAPAPEASAPRPRRTWDLVLSSALVLLGVFDVVTGIATYNELGNLLRLTAQAQDFGEFSSVELADQVGVGLNVFRVILLVLTIAATLLLLQRRRVAFWVPLTAGVIAGVVVVVCIIALLIGDPGFNQYVLERSAR